MFAIKYVYEYEKLKNEKKIRRISWKKKDLFINLLLATNIKKKKKKEKQKRSLYNQYITENLGENLIMINKIKY